MFSRLILVVVPVLLVFAPALAPGSENDFMVVVSESSSIDTISATELSQIFFKQSKTGPNGRLVVPIDQSSTAEVRKAFSIAIHGRSPASVKAIWYRLVFSGQSVPPVEMGSDSEILMAVRADPNSIGYVSLSTTIGKGVKVVKVKGL